MAPRKVLVVFGTRPEAIKMAPVVLELRARPAEFEAVVAVTAQHRHLLDRVLALFDIVPDHDLDIMRERQTLTEITVRALTGLTGLVESVAPDAVLVQGDTTTTFAAALAAFYHKVPVGHVEAGLRTNDLMRPYPEEANRRLTAQLARWHFAPTQWAAGNLLSEGVAEDAVHITGNTVVDALGTVAGEPWEWEPGPIRDALMSGGRIVLVTAHRRENWGAPVLRICAAVREIVERFPDVRVLFATHPNPAVAGPVGEALAGLERVDLIGALDYVPFVHLQRAATLILSDSGGIQEEAPSLGTPVLVMRETTERPEALAAGIVRLVGTDTARIANEAARLLSDPEAYASMTCAANPFGDGHAASRICDILERDLPAR